MGFWDGFKNGSGLDKVKADLFGANADSKGVRTPLLERLGRGTGIIIVGMIKMPWFLLKKLYEANRENDLRREREEKQQKKKKGGKKKKKDEQDSLFGTSPFGRL